MESGRPVELLGVPTTKKQQLYIKLAINLNSYLC